jgi:predicted PurR-regulated permease PerM
VPLLLSFLVVYLLEGLADWLVWRGRRRGAILSPLLLPAGAVYCWGFALSFGPIFACARTLLMVQRWNRLR